MNTYRRYKKPVVQLTSLLDLLFVMIFVSLMQTKVSPTADPLPAPKATITKAKATAERPAPRVAKIPLTASFNFYPSVKNPDIPSGTFNMEGVFTESGGKLQLNGVEWVDRPPHYDMVPLVGKINEDKNLFTGKIEFPGCREFTLKRTSVKEGS
ncbi:MAG: hypothetical protein ACLGHN_12335, partial [Bacteriovoracia bacterium]